MQRRVWAVLMVVVLLAGRPAWAARDMCKLLKDKGVLTDAEYAECVAAQEKEEAQGESKVKDLLNVQLPLWLNKFSPFGDVRVRQEGFYENHMTANNRQRVRARFGFNYTQSDEIGATVRLATGNSDDPISTNQTFQDTFTRKPVNLDWAYLTVKPGTTLNLPPGLIAIYGGKMPLLTYRVSEMLWDDDLSPEGATEILTLLDRKEGFLRRLRLIGVQWVVDQISNASDPWIGGVQVATDAAVGSAASWSTGLGDYHYSNMNSVAEKYFNKYSNPPANTQSNSSYNSSLANGNDIVKNANGLITGYLYQFNLLNLSSELDFPNPFGLGLPAGTFGDVVYNTQASHRNLGFYVGVGIGAAGQGWYWDNLKNQGDWSVSYTFTRMEKDATVSLFSFSDVDYVQANVTQKGSTNEISNIVRIDYMLLQNFQLTAKALVINALDAAESNVALSGNPTLVRTQFDAMLRF